MKRWIPVFVVIFLAIVAILSLSFFKVESEQDGITGKQVEGSFSVSINIVGEPSMSLNYPKNHTYFNDTIRVGITSNGDNFWYGLDGSSNISFSKEANISVSSGGHTLYVYANNSYGIVSDNVSFSVAPDVLSLNFSDFSDSGDGFTDFNTYSYDEIQNLEDITLGNPNHGKISFNSAINVTDDSNFSDSIVDLDGNINISHNRIELNSTALPNFNKSATLLLYNLSFTNPRVLKDGAQCNDCSENSYSSGIFSFNVSSFSVYSSEETPSGTQDSGVSSGGGGGSGSVVFLQPSDPEFSVSPERVLLEVLPGEEKIVKFKVENKGAEDIDVLVHSERINELAFFDSDISVPGGSARDFFVTFSAPSDMRPGLYTGKIVFSSGRVNQSSFVSVEVGSDEALFDIFLDIIGRRAFFTGNPVYYGAGEEVIAQVKFLEVRDVGRVDLEIEYGIIDETGRIINSKSQTQAVDRQADIVLTLGLPEEIPKGNYLYYVNAVYLEQMTSASQFFSIDDATMTYNLEILLIFIFAFLIVVSVLLIRIMKKLNKFHNKKEKAGIKNVLRKSKKKRK